MSFSPRTGLVYIPAVHSAYLYEPDPAFAYARGHMNTGEDFEALAERTEGYEDLVRAGCAPTRLLAWDPIAGKPAWEVRFSSAVPGGVLSTAGGLVFQGGGGGLAARGASIASRMAPKTFRVSASAAALVL